MPLGCEPVQYLFTIEDEIEVHDIAWGCVVFPVACSYEESPIQIRGALKRDDTAL